MTRRSPMPTSRSGTELPAAPSRSTRGPLVRYAGASGDFNPIHWNERFAREVHLPDVIAHGMFTMAEAIRVVTDWVGDPGASGGVRRPFHQAGRRTERWTRARSIGWTAKVAALLDDHRVRVDLTATSAGQKVLGMSRAVVPAVP